MLWQEDDQAEATSPMAVLPEAMQPKVHQDTSGSEKEVVA
jgi:hypothetical protein